MTPNIFKTKVIVTLTVFVLIFWIGYFVGKNSKSEIIQYNDYQYIVDSIRLHPKTIQDSIFSEIYNCRIEHPDIVYAQAVLETGNFQSKLFVEGYNCFGMKVPGQRPTLARSILYGHAQFDNWKESIYDYAIWQSRYCKNLTREQYLNFLSKNYAECSEYVNKLLQIISQIEK